MKKNKFGIILFLLPALLIFGFVFFQSIIMLVVNSFSNYNGVERLFAGFSNYIEIWQDETFLKAVWNTFKWVLIQSTIHLGLGITVAVILARRKWYWKFVRVGYMIPNMVAAAALGIMFVNMLNPQFGIINALIEALGFDFSPNWLYDKQYAFLAVTMTWLPYAGIVTVLTLAEITSIDKSMFEAASVDGASEFQQIRYITLPSIRSIAATCCIISATSMLQKFDIIYMSTMGGPDDLTMNLPMYIYNMTRYNNYGLSSTAGVFLIAVGLTSIVLINTIFRTSQVDY